MDGALSAAGASEVRIDRLTVLDRTAPSADIDLGMRTNLDGTRAMLHRCRASGRTPVVVFAGSLAVFGSTVGYPMPELVTDHTLPQQRRLRIELASSPVTHGRDAMGGRLPACH